MPAQLKTRTAHGPDPVKPRKALNLPSRLAYLYAPILPYVKWIKIVRKGPRVTGQMFTVLLARYV